MSVIEPILRFIGRNSYHFLVPILRHRALRRMKSSMPQTIEKIQSALDVERAVAHDIYRKGISSEIQFGLDYAWIANAKTNSVLQEVDRVNIQNIERLNALVETRRPILILSIHMGSFYLGFLKLAMSVPGSREINVIKVASQSQREDALHSLIEHKFGKINVFRFDDDVGKNAYHALRKGGVVAMMADVEVRVASRACIQLFGQTCYMQSGPAVLALTSRAVILPIVNYENTEGQPIICIEEPIYPDRIIPGESNGEIITRLTAEVATKIESWIRMAPTQFHRWPDMAATMCRKGSSDAT